MVYGSPCAGKHFTLHKVMNTKIFMRKYRKPTKYTHCVYCQGEKVASIACAFNVYRIKWHVDFFNVPHYGAICSAILNAASRIDSHKNILIYED